MLRASTHTSGWQGVVLLAITYVYFLIFAQFAFLKRLVTLGVGGGHLQAIMAAMAAGGIAFSLLAPRINLWPSPSLRLRIGLCTSSAAAFLSLLPLGVAASAAVSFLIGAGLGLITVTLAAHLREWTGNRNPLLLVGLGTGAGYFLCNTPALFNASAEIQAEVAGVLCLLGLFATARPSIVLLEKYKLPALSSLRFPAVLACFAALVWLDSAAFFIIQNTPMLKAGTWQGEIHLWSNGLLHLTAALVSAWLLSRRSLSFVLSAAFVALGIACLLLLDPNRAALASVFYPIGVSLYSVALVAYPSLLSPAVSATGRARIAGWIYAIAGWLGSAMGIGMGQHLGSVPPAFVFIAGLVVLFPALFRLARHRARELALTAALLLAAFYVYRIGLALDVSPQLSQIDRGRQVYISEGCIHCHSQYVRPNSPDVLLWGPVETIAELRQQQPPLIGNRRQGPDLSQAGGRRSPLWLRAHFFNPAEVSGVSIMPAFGFLFADRRGNDLVAYLASLHTPGTSQHQADERLWQPSPQAVANADSALGKELYQQDCATCHSKDGRTRLAWQSNFKRLPPDLTAGPFYYLPPSGSSAQRLPRLAQIVKFGIPGTDMAGHEYLSDQQVASLALWLSLLTQQPGQN
jgi:cytochrome c oxidase cbb3-type subunit 2